MKSTISILLFFALPFVIYCGKVSKKFEEEVKNINNLAKNGMEINEVLLLKEDGFLDEGSYGFVYEGTFKEHNCSVAIKFVKNRHFEECEEEFAMYCYLKAYKNESVLIYGIPVVYYFDRWEDYILMAFTKFDMNLLDVADGVTTFCENDLDILILLRDFVFQSKYLHSHGVRHDDIKPANIMLRGHRSFLIDLNASSKMNEDNCGGTPRFKCKRYSWREIRRPIDDYESFIYTIGFITGKNWFKPEYNDNKIRKKNLRNDGLEKAIKAFADEVFTNNASKRFPNYNNLEKIISEEIKGIHPNGELKFSWPTFDAETSPERKITDITEPKSINFTQFVYPPIGPSPSRQVTQISMSIGPSPSRQVTQISMPIGPSPSRQVTQISMPTKKKSSMKYFGCFSIQPSD